MARHLDSLGFTVFAGCLDTASFHYRQDHDFELGNCGGCDDDIGSGNNKMLRDGVDSNGENDNYRDYNNLNLFSGERRCPETEG